MEINRYEKEHNARLRMLAPECTVLLKKNGDFPMAAPGKIALYGNGARHTVKGGTGSGDVNSRFYITAEQGLKDAGFTLTSTKWLDAYDVVRAQAKKDFIAEVNRIAKEKKTMADETIIHRKSLYNTAIYVSRDGVLNTKRNLFLKTQATRGRTPGCKRLSAN